MDAKHPDHPDSYLRDWQAKEELAEAMLPVIGRLYRNHGVTLLLYGRSLVHASTIDILKAHRYSRQLTARELSVMDTYPLVTALAGMDLAATEIDIGTLTTRYLEADSSLETFLTAEGLAGKPAPSLPPRDVVLYGFGRIGRLLARIMIERAGGADPVRLRAIVLRRGAADDLQKRASLLRRDSIHGPFNGTIQTDEVNSAIIANGTYITVIRADTPASIDYTAYGIKEAIVIDNTGIWRDQAGLEQHLTSKGVAKVLLTAPGKGAIKNIVYGVNQHEIGQDTIVSAASCTTNAIVPVLKAVNDKFTIVNGHVETVHAYTNDQNLTDNIHKKARRGRSAPLNMVLTETGAAKAVEKALPELTGKLTGNAIRVPTPNVSMAILNLNLAREVSKAELNSYLRDMSLCSELREQIDYRVSTELVSSDLVGSEHAGIVDGPATITQANRCVLYVWYDNEAGYSHQVMRVARALARTDTPALAV